MASSRRIPNERARRRSTNAVRQCAECPAEHRPARPPAATGACRAPSPRLRRIAAARRRSRSASGSTTRSTAQVMATAEQRPRLRAAACASRRCARAAAPCIVSCPAPRTAFEQANIYARASGYVAKRNVDIGDQVKAGRAARRDHRARARPPDRAGGGTLAQLQADAASRRRPTANSPQVTWDRDKPLVKQGWVTRSRATPTADPAGAAAGGGQRRAGQHRGAGGAAAGAAASRRSISAWSRRSTASSPSATSTSAAWCRPTRPAAPSCSR